MKGANLMNRKELLLMEARMNWSSDDEVFEEGVSDTIQKFTAKLVAQIKKIIAEMTAFAKELKLSVDTALYSSKLKMRFGTLKRQLMSGQTVYLPDFKSVDKIYRTEITKLKKEVAHIRNSLNPSFLKKITKNEVERYMKQKEDLAKEIDDITVQLSVDSLKKIELKSESQFEPAVNKMVAEYKMYMSEYIKLTSDLEKCIINFEKNTYIAESSYEAKLYCRETMSMLQTVKVKSTKLCRKAVFLFCATFGI
jgi:hypothetical protein